MDAGTLALLFSAVSGQLSLPPHLLSSVCYVESKHDVSAISHMDGHSNSRGICQIKRASAMAMGFEGSATDLMEPSVNILYAGKLLAYHLKQCGSTARAVMAYNTGACNKPNLSYLNKVNYTLSVQYGEAKNE